MDQEKTKNCVLLYSGGMDSMVLLHQSIKKYDKIYILSFDYNQRHKKEIVLAKEYIEFINKTTDKIKSYTIVNLEFYSELASTSSLTNKNIDVPKMKDIIGHPQSVTYVPNRNMVMLSIASGYAESVKAADVLTAVVALDNLSGYWDTTQEFVNGFNDVIHLNRMNNITIQSPLVDMSKEDIIKEGVKLGADFSKSWTCYEGLEEACGVCPSCSGRLAGFVKSGYKDPIKYQTQIDWQKYNCVNIK
jgi:7-cyano-7-deazaguanine synthase